jgi:hypothetical protein
MPTLCNLSAVVAGLLLLIVSVSWISFLVVGVALVAYEVFLQRLNRLH